MNSEGSGDWNTPRVSRVRPFPNRLLGSYPTPYTPITEGPLIEEEENATPCTPVSEGGLCSSSSEVEDKPSEGSNNVLSENRQTLMELQMSKLQEQVQGLSGNKITLSIIRPVLVLKCCCGYPKKHIRNINLKKIHKKKF